MPRNTGGISPERRGSRPPLGGWRCGARPRPNRDARARTRRWHRRTEARPREAPSPSWLQPPLQRRKEKIQKSRHVLGLAEVVDIRNDDDSLADGRWPRDVAL